MDRLLYVSMTGAKNNAIAQAVYANNLANVSTIGFKQDFAQARSMQIFGDSFPSRVYGLTEHPGTDFNHGTLIETSRPLDVSVHESGFITVEDADGKEAYTRNGSFLIDVMGILRLSSGAAVKGDAGPIYIPPYEKLEIARDGNISIRAVGQPTESMIEVNRIKLVNPRLDEISKGIDGLFRRTDDLIESPDASVNLVSGVLEASNVNSVNAMVQILSLSRQFELSIKMMRTAEENDETVQRLVQGA